MALKALCLMLRENKLFVPLAKDRPPEPKLGIPYVDNNPRLKTFLLKQFNKHTRTKEDINIFINRYLSQLDSKYNLRSKTQLKTRNSPKRIHHLNELIKEQNLGLEHKTFSKLKKSLKTSPKINYKVTTNKKASTLEMGSPMIRIGTFFSNVVEKPDSREAKEKKVKLPRRLRLLYERSKFFVQSPKLVMLDKMMRKIKGLKVDERIYGEEYLK